MTRESESKYVSWTWIVSILVGILMLLGGYVVNDTRATVCRLQDQKVDRIEFERVYSQTNESFKTVSDKIDRLTEIALRNVKDKK
jgi:hypothetical protein